MRVTMRATWRATIEADFDRGGSLKTPLLVQGTANILQKIPAAADSHDGRAYIKTW